VSLPETSSVYPGRGVDRFLASGIPHFVLLPFIRRRTGRKYFLPYSVPRYIAGREA